jgi:hypothetical protein
MRRLALLPLLAVGLLAPGRAPAADGWTALKRGMTPTQAMAALGKPLVRTAGRGFEVWIYDQHTEVVFFRGPVVAWTDPAQAASPARATVADHDTFEWPVLRLSRATANRRCAPVETGPVEFLPTSQFLYQQHR